MLATCTCNKQCKWKKKPWMRLTEFSGWKRIFSRCHTSGCAYGLGRDFCHTLERETRSFVRCWRATECRLDSYRMYRSLAAQGCKALVVTTVCTSLSVQHSHHIPSRFRAEVCWCETSVPAERFIVGLRVSAIKFQIGRIIFLFFGVSSVGVVFSFLVHWCSA